MAHHVCPWWGSYFIDNRLRRFLHNPAKLLDAYVKPGMTALDFGCGMGLFSIAMANMVGSTGTVVAADLQPQVLRVVRKRAEKAGVDQRIRTHQCSREFIDIGDTFDFVLAFWSVHEVPDIEKLLSEIHACLANEGTMLVAEPCGHVSQKNFQRMLEIAQNVGLQFREPAVRIRWSHAAALVKGSRV